MSVTGADQSCSKHLKDVCLIIKVCHTCHAVFRKYRIVVNFSLPESLTHLPGPWKDLRGAHHLHPEWHRGIAGYDSCQSNLSIRAGHWLQAAEGC
jgi:hypothetical protein